MNGRLIERRRVSGATRDEMFELLDRHFEGVDRSRFAADLAEKNWVLLLTDDAERLVGFTTLHLGTTFHRGRELAVVYSGDTIVDQVARSSSVLSRSWIEAIQRLRARLGFESLVWLLLTSGFRTYRTLPLFWREFFPRHDLPTPEATQSLIDHLSIERFGESYDRSAGVVRFARPQVLRPRLRGIPEGRLRDPHVAFFARANPGHARGDELVCLTEIASANLTLAGWRMVRAGAARGIGGEAPR